MGAGGKCEEVGGLNPLSRFATAPPEGEHLVVVPGAERDQGEVAPRVRPMAGPRTGSTAAGASSRALRRRTPQDEAAARCCGWG